MYRLCIVAFLLLGSMIFAHPAWAQIHHVTKLNTEQIRTLDRDKTVVLLPGGILEQHGPYLPLFADGYMNEWITARLAETIVARPGWNVLIFPMIPLGAGGANEVGRRHVFPGTFAVRAETLRDVFLDLATELGEQGFQWVFIVHDHGAPNHNRMLDQAGDYFRDTYGGRMVNLMGLMPVFTAEARYESGETLSKEEREEEGLSVHAGAAETAALLFLRPEYVQAGYRTAPPQTGKDWNDLVERALDPDWPGYFGSPRLASASMGAHAMEAEMEAAVKVALQILDGTDDRSFPRFGDLALESPDNISIDQDALRRDEEVRRQQADWLRSRGHE